MTSLSKPFTFIPFAFALLLSLLHTTSSAQSTVQNEPSIMVASTPTLSPSDAIPLQPIGSYPSSTASPKIAQSTISNHFSTPSPSSSSSARRHQDDEDSGILNYYFLLLAFFIIILGIAYLLYVRRQRLKLAQSRLNGQNALARDLERWGGGPWGPPRFRFPRQTARHPRREEGLNERGEAPPPYIPKEPEQALFSEPGHRRTAQAIPLRDMAREEQKPPDYEEGPSGDDFLNRTAAGPNVR
ncbi:MAG: hypothetical protein LQ342_005908 [Letrouitia transgressa]|nr:MAG: hypothetical protein LQ342_005908 [Letrouitia transgressa]